MPHIIWRDVKGHTVRVLPYDLEWTILDFLPNGGMLGTLGLVVVKSKSKNETEVIPWNTLRNWLRSGRVVVCQGSS